MDMVDVRVNLSLIEEWSEGRLQYILAQQNDL